MANALQKVDTAQPMETWFTRSHKAAIVLASLSAETAAAVVDDISDAQLKTFAKAFCELKSVPPQLLHAVAQEFLAEINQKNNDLAGGADETRRVLGLMASEERADRILSDLDGGAGDGGNVWERVEKLDDEVLADYVQKQRMPVGAAILAKLDYEKTAAVLDKADDGYAKQILIELARKKPPSPAAIEAIAQVLEEDLLKPAPGAAEDGEEGDGEEAKSDGAGGATGAVGEIVNNLPGAKRDAFLAHLQESDPEVGAAVKRALLIFEDLHARVPANGAPAVMRDIERETLLTAIKHGEKNAPETVEFLFGNISKRMVEQYKEELAEMDEPSETDGEAAQREITAAVRRLVRDGEFKLNAIEEPETEKAE
ncbi:FliG C-terminal domain-containing protein [Hyphococcus sp.]|uniref:FliG C-terminal domain-containing protein n=1 Tax=Hyphococcus sp. TaxID=2038636 RepID=UPI003CCBC58C